RDGHVTGVQTCALPIYLLMAKSNPTTNYQTGDAWTTYTYYTANDGFPGWIGRLKTETMPANVSGYRASETYEYDRELNGGVTNQIGRASCRERGEQAGW